MIRHEYAVHRADYRPSGRDIPPNLTVRTPVPEDGPALADLMMDAYVGTIDYDGESHEQAVKEVDGYFASMPLLLESRLAIDEGVIQSGSLISLDNSDAFVGYVMTRATAKNQGLGAALLDLCVEAIWTAGHDRIRAWITGGNEPSERIFLRAGFEVIGTWDSEEQG